jgi:hypothetical protein
MSCVASALGNADPIEVQVQRVDLETRRIEFRLVQRATQKGVLQALTRDVSPPQLKGKGVKVVKAEKNSVAITAPKKANKAVGKGPPKSTKRRRQK